MKDNFTPVLYLAFTRYRLIHQPFDGVVQEVNSALKS